MYLLDTNVLSELRKSKPHGAVIAWIRGVDDRHLHISAVSLGEIQVGIEITRGQDAERAAEIEAWADHIADTWSVLPLDGAAFRLWGRLMHGKSDELIADAMIAATAKLHGLSVVTRNVKDFKEFGVELINPFMAR
ncbi:MAG: type II toxin-antitoxin system VapC family toxin [Rhizobiales bacterium]|nr:type II toxin-antitoxin system VapC family toxin [Hyphomicrobiales bacterium]